MTFEDWLRTLPEDMQRVIDRFAFVKDKFREAFRQYQEAKKLFRPRE